MSLYLSPQDWVSTIREEYLRDFILEGGAAVKFVVTASISTQRVLLENLRRDALDEDYVFISLDAEHVRVHMVDRVFHEVAKHVAWDDLARAFITRIVAALKYRLPDDPAELTLDLLASLNGETVQELRPRLVRELRDTLLRDYGLTQEFRIAMLWLCRAQLEPEGANLNIAGALKEWLRGELRSVSALKPASLFQKVGRHNARYMLLSLSRWLHVCGKAGLVITLNVTRFLEPRRRGESDGTVYYNTAAVMDGYEVLRQLVDGTDETAYCLVVITAPPTLLASDEPRGLGGYEALKLRVLDEVHDRQRANPLAPLVRIS